MAFVVDASVAIAWFVKGQATDYTNALLHRAPQEIAASKKHKPRRSGSRLRKQPGVIEICGDDDPRFRSRVLDDLVIRRALQSRLCRVNGVVAALREPSHQSRREWHIDEELHPARSTVSSSANIAA